jgi:hypothetical protein
VERRWGGEGAQFLLFFLLSSPLWHSRKHGFSIAKAGGKGFFVLFVSGHFRRFPPGGSSGLSTVAGGVVAWTVAGVLKEGGRSTVEGAEEEEETVV